MFELLMFIPGFLAVILIAFSIGKYAATDSCAFGHKWGKWELGVFKFSSGFEGNANIRECKRCGLKQTRRF